jgi:hypothetical protein
MSNRAQLTVTRGKKRKTGAKKNCIWEMHIFGHKNTFGQLTQKKMQRERERDLKRASEAKASGGSAALVSKRGLV